jgi:opacity protein-like surface antigen
MKGKQVVRTGIFLVLFAAVLSQTALAQEKIPAVELSGGYSFFRDFEIDQNSNGWIGSAGVNFNKFAGIHGEIGTNYGSVDAMGSKVNLRITSVLGGPRFSYRKVSHLTPFAHVFLGMTDRGSDYYGSGQTDLAWQMGGGVDSWLTPGFAVRAGGDYRHIFSDDTPSNGFRFQVGIVVGIGSRR